jgi:hypothetical protein
MRVHACACVCLCVHESACGVFFLTLLISLTFASAHTAHYYRRVVKAMETLKLLAYSRCVCDVYR